MSSTFRAASSRAAKSKSSVPITPRFETLTPARQRQVPKDSSVTGGPSAVMLKLFSGWARAMVAQRGPGGPSARANRLTLSPATTTRSPEPGSTMAQSLIRSNRASGSALRLTLAPGFSETSRQPLRPNTGCWPGVIGKLGCMRQPSDWVTSTWRGP